MASKVNGKCHAGRLKGHRAGDPEALFSVCLEHVGKAETLATDFTRVWLFPCMCASMPLHIGPTGKTLPTDLTDEWLLTCVCLHVLVEILFHVEVFATPLAHKLLVSYVNAHMRPQLVFVLKPLVTVLTTEGLLS